MKNTWALKTVEEQVVTTVTKNVGAILTLELSKEELKVLRAICGLDVTIPTAVTQFNVSAGDTVQMLHQLRVLAIDALMMCK